MDAHNKTWGGTSSVPSTPNFVDPAPGSMHMDMAMETYRHTFPNIYLGEIQNLRRLRTVWCHFLQR